eukprot:2135118-Rhodomonas_salina.1
MGILVPEGETLMLPALVEGRELLLLLAICHAPDRLSAYALDLLTAYAPDRLSWDTRFGILGTDYEHVCTGSVRASGRSAVLISCAFVPYEPAMRGTDFGR